MLPLGVVNAFLIAAGSELALVDTGSPGNAGRLVLAVEALGHQIEDIRHIVITHSHPDHVGNLAELKRLTGAPVYMHPLEAAVVRRETPMRAIRPAPGVIRRLVFRLFIAPNLRATLPLVTVEHELLDGDELPIAEGLRAVHVPGHCGGHLAYLSPRHGGLVFTGDAAANMLGLGLSLGYEDLEVGLRGLAKLSRLRFRTACFSHGPPILRDASQRFREKWGSQR
jgi:glyoxylase-like metal-dependent hydrolase (beta-lactamase superfamily II)